MISEKKTYQLNKIEINQILKLKNKFWKYGLKSQNIWFKNNIGKNDIHFFEKKNNQILCYLVFRKIIFFTKNKIKNGYLRDTLINKKKNNFFQFLYFLKKSNMIINNKPAVLFCRNNLIKLNQLYGWRKKNIKNIIPLKTKNLNCMVLNIKNNEHIENIKFLK